MRQAMLRENGAAGPSVARLARGLLRQSRALSVDYLLLAVLDARSAAVKFAWLLCSGVVAAILLVTAWLALVAGGIVWMRGTGASWVLALGVAASINLVGAGLLALWMRGLFDEPPLSATLRQLRRDDSAVVAPEARR
jgi:type VI protein secretion system component VasK